MEPVKKKKKKEKKDGRKGEGGEKRHRGGRTLQKSRSTADSAKGEEEGKDELSRRRSAFSGEGEKRKVVVGGERKEGGEKREKEREREKLCGIVQFFSMAPETSLLLFSFRKKKKKFFSKEFPSSPLFLILTVKNKEKK